MLKINPSSKSVQEQKIKSMQHENHMGGVSYNISNPIYALKIVALSSFFGEPSYYDKMARHERDEKSLSKFSQSQLNKFQHNEEILERILPSLSSETSENYVSDEAQYSTVSYMEMLIDNALNFDAKSTLELAAELRDVHHIRTTPQVILVRAANHKAVRDYAVENKKSLIVEYANKIIQRTDEVTVQLAYQMQVFGKPIPNSLKKAWSQYLEKQNDYSLAKYRMEKRAYKLVDVVNVSHPKSESIDKLMKGKLKLVDNKSTWESYISQNGSNKDTWTHVIKSGMMGHMALLRNLRNLLKNNVDVNLFIEDLVNGVEEGKQLPFRYLSAYNEINNINCATTGISASSVAAVLDALDDCIDKSIVHLPKLSGKIASLSDNSGSAHGCPISTMSKMTVAQIGNLMSVLTARTSENVANVDVLVFGDKLINVPVRKNTSVLSQTEQVNELGKTVGMSTENGIWIFFKEILKNKTHYDHVFIYSDMQAGHGGLYGSNSSDYYEFKYERENGNKTEYIDVAKLIKKYHSEVNPNCKFYLVQIAGYDDTIVPEFYKNVYVLGGWSDQILKFASEMQIVSESQFTPENKLTANS